MAVWNPGDPPPPPLSFVTTSVAIPAEVNWASDRYIDVQPRGCIAANSGDHLCGSPPPAQTDPADYVSVSTDGPCELEMCVSERCDTHRFFPFPINSRMVGCEDDEDPHAQVTQALENSEATQVAKRFFTQLDATLDPALNAIPGGTACAREALRAVLQARAALGLVTGGVACDIGTAFALVEARLGAFLNNGVQIAGGLGLTTDYGMPTGGGANPGTNLTGDGGGWIAALHTRPGHGFTRNMHPDSGRFDQHGTTFYDIEQGCFVPTQKKWGIAAHDVGMVTFAHVDLSC